MSLTFELPAFRLELPAAQGKTWREVESTIRRLMGLKLEQQPTNKAGIIGPDYVLSDETIIFTSPHKG